jgi:hypothetical protein
MDCRELEEARILLAYDEESPAGFREHVLLCDRCRDAVGEIRRVREEYRKTRDVGMPGSVRQRLAPPRRLRWTLAAAALVGFGLWMGARARIEPPPAAAVVESAWRSTPRAISEELSRIDQELGWHELVLRR